MRTPFLLTLCIVVYLPHEAAMATLPRIQDPEVILPKIPDGDTDQFYTAYGNHICKMCPPGTFVFKHCSVPRTEGTCRPCENHTFSKIPNSFPFCFRCRACRTLDEVEIKECTATTDTKCACKNGTFCSSGQPCETCTNCKTSCGPGERKVQDCTPTSDIQCLPDTTSSPPTSSPAQRDRGLAWLIVVAVVLLAVLVLCIVFCWIKNTTFRTACTDFWERKRTQFFQYLQKSSIPEPSEVRDNILDRQSCRTANGQVLEMIPLRAPPSEEEGQQHPEMRKLVPRNNKTAAETLRLSFDAFVNKVPTKDWNRFMRRLGLTPNEIDSAEKSSCFMCEQHYQMLRTWLDKTGQAATLSRLLEELCALDLKGVAEDITSFLLYERLYVYEE